MIMKDSGDLHVYDHEYKSSCPRGHWRPAEDQKLRRLVEQYGAQNWNSIAEKLQGRSGTPILSSNISSISSFGFERREIITVDRL